MITRKSCFILLFVVFAGLCVPTVAETPTMECDVLVIGGGVGGFGAAIQAARMGSDVILVEETPWLGGMMTSAGVSAFDGNNYSFNTGLFREIRTKIEDYYGGPQYVHTGWVSLCSFEPHVGKDILFETAGEYPDLTLMMESTLKQVLREGDRIQGAVIENASGVEIEIRAWVTIEATEYGDVLKMGNIPYRLGRESRYETLETEAPEVPDQLVQDLTYVTILKEYPGEDRTWPSPPEGYDPSLFECCCQKACSGYARHTFEHMMDYGDLPNDKYMINWPIQGNDYFLLLYDMTPGERKAALELAKQHSKNFLYYHQTVLGASDLDLADDEYPTPDLMPYIPYVRESRRMVGSVIYRLFDIKDRYGSPSGPLYKTYVAVGDYFVDHHHSAHNTPTTNHGEHYGSIPQVGMPFGSLIPESIDGFLAAEKSTSITHIVNGVTRLQPFVMLTGQAAGAAAGLAARDRIEPREIDLRQLQQTLLDARASCFPMDDLYDNAWNFQEIQRVALSGVMRVEDEGTATRFWSAATVPANELPPILSRVLQQDEISSPVVDLESEDLLTREQLALLVEEFSPAGIPAAATPFFSDVSTNHPSFDAIQLFHQRGLGTGWISGGRFEPAVNFTRAHLAVGIDRVFDPFHTLPVEIAPEPDYSEWVTEKLPARWKLHFDNSVEDWTGTPPSWFLSTSDANRDLAYNPKTGHLLVTDLVNHQVHILSATSGADSGVLDASAISTSSRLSVATVDVDDAGVIYATPYEKNPFRIYRWQNESATCEVVFEGVLSVDAGRDLEVLGSGDSSKIIVARSTDAGAFLVFAQSEPGVFELEAAVSADTGGFGDYGVFGLAVENEQSVYVKGRSGALRHFVFSGGSWDEESGLAVGDFDSGATAKMMFASDGKLLMALAVSTSGPYIFESTAASISGGLTYKMNDETGPEIQAAALLELINANPNAAGGLDVDPVSQTLFLCLPRNGIAAYDMDQVYQTSRLHVWQGY